MMSQPPCPWSPLACGEYENEKVCNTNKDMEARFTPTLRPQATGLTQCHCSGRLTTL